jgi:hypothetical protein
MCACLISSLAVGTSTVKSIQTRYRFRLHVWVRLLLLLIPETLLLFLRMYAELRALVTFAQYLCLSSMVNCKDGADLHGLDGAFDSMHWVYTHTLHI